MDAEMTDMIKIVVKIPLGRYNELKDHVDQVGTTISAFARVAMSEKLAAEGAQAVPEE
jgi:hypothetical protein